VRDLYEIAFRAKFDRDYRALFRKLALSPQQIDRFERRLFEDNMDKLDLHWTGEAQGLTKNDAALGAVRKEQEAALRIDLQAILGEDGYSALEQFRRANGVRGFVNDLATAMTLSERAMTLDQQDKLVQVIAEASARYQKGGNAMPWDANWDSIMAQAPSFLNEQQVAALRDNGDHYVRFVWMLPQFYAQRGNGK
jgi:hypothetical protein